MCRGEHDPALRGALIPSSPPHMGLRPHAVMPHRNEPSSKRLSISEVGRVAPALAAIHQYVEKVSLGQPFLYVLMRGPESKRLLTAKAERDGIDGADGIDGGGVGSTGVGWVRLRSEVARTGRWCERKARSGYRRGGRLMRQPVSERSMNPPAASEPRQRMAVSRSTPAEAAMVAGPAPARAGTASSTSAVWGSRES